MGWIMWTIELLDSNGEWLGAGLAEPYEGSLRSDVLVSRDGILKYTRLLWEGISRGLCKAPEKQVLVGERIEVIAAISWDEDIFENTKEEFLKKYEELCLKYGMCVTCGDG